MSESLSEKAERLREARRGRCRRGYHEDPDHSGLCINCAAVLDPFPDEEAKVRAREQLEAVARGHL